MDLLDGKNALVFGLANERSIAWGITQALHREGANIGISYAGEMLKRRVMPLAEKIGCTWVEECDVTKDENIDNVAEKAAGDFGQIDVLVHSIAFAGRDELTGPFYNTSREGFKNAMDISVYSFVALARAFQPILRAGASLICMTYYGHPLSCLRFWPAAGARQCHFRRTDPHAGSGRCRRLSRYV